jgi:hypothetical protein
LPADKRNKNSWRPFYFPDFLRLAASATEPRALQARLDGLLSSTLSVRSSRFVGAARLENHAK